MAKSKLAVPPTILAIAIGEVELTVSITVNPPPSFVRPYINGLVAGLSNNSKTIGKDYTIDYRECPVGHLQDYAFNNWQAADVIFCMSQRVMKKAFDIMHPPHPLPELRPIVGVISDYAGYNDPKKKIYGFSAKRFQTALACYNAFLATVPSLQSVYVLHDKNHPPSVNALAQLPKTAIEIDVSDYNTPIPQKLTAMWQGVTGFAGVLVLPIDRCFGAADAINGWGINNQVPIFWPITDRVYSTTVPSQPSALGGYGVSQEHCGEVMGGQVASILSGAEPNPHFVDAVTYSPATTSNTDITWAASRAAASATDTLLVTPIPQGLTVR